MRDWSKRITWLNIPQLKLGNIQLILSNFENPLCCKKHLKDNKLGAQICSDICPWTLSVPQSPELSWSYALGKLFSSPTDNVRRQTSEHIPAPNGGCCLYIVYILIVGKNLSLSNLAKEYNQNNRKYESRQIEGNLENCLGDLAWWRAVIILFELSHNCMLLIRKSILSNWSVCLTGREVCQWFDRRRKNHT